MKQTIIILIFTIFFIPVFAQNNSLFNNTEIENNCKHSNSLYNKIEIQTSNGTVEYYQEWNSLYERYDIKDRYGKLIGYYRYNSLYDRWEYIKSLY